MAINSIPEAVLWHEGMLLAPQHFQHFSARVDGLVESIPPALAPFYWGIQHIQIDRRALAAGMLVVEELEAILRDGLHITIPAGARPLEVDLRPQKETFQRAPTVVHLAVPSRGSVGKEFRRYQPVSGDPVPDQNSEASPIEIPRLSPNLSLLASGNVPGKYVSLPLVEVSCEGDLFQAEEYVAPSLSMRASPQLKQIAASVAEKLRRTAETLAGRVAMAAGATAVELRGQWAAFVRHLPFIDALCQADAVHPFSVFLALTQIAGELAAIGPASVPPGFEAYDHDRPLRSFQLLSQYIQDAADAAVPRGLQRFVFQKQGGLFRLEPAIEWTNALAAGSPYSLILSVEGTLDMSEAEAAAWGENCLIGSADRIPVLEKARILGAGRQHVERFGELRAPRGAQLFLLSDWEGEIVSGIDLVVEAAAPDAPAPQGLSLYLAKEESAAAKA